MKHTIFQYDPLLKVYEKDFDLRKKNYEKKKNELLQQHATLKDFASGHLYFGFHKEKDGWYYREWAPAAEKMYLTGDFCNWDRYAYPMEKGENGVFSLFLPGSDSLQDGQKVMAVVVSGGKELERIPLYIHRVLQDPETIAWNGVIYDPKTPFSWTDADFKPQKKLFIYECHIGMAQEEGKVGTYEEFRTLILPKIRDLGYNTIQIMAIMEHPYYASFGYQVTNFFAASSRFGTPEELKKLIDTAHKMGIAVLLDVVHSHACKNTREGINEFDGTDYQFFHAGPMGEHPAWNTKCFNYDKNEVIHFLLSNLRYWMEEYHFDGFRFDGVTSMLYRDHGLGTAFTGYDQYFSMNTIAEDTSALPGLALPISKGGVGFDYRLAMGEPDMWIRLLKETPDEYWDLNSIYYELSIRRPKEPVIGYCESHDQALVGDKTIMFRLCDKEMYWGMGVNQENMIIDRGMALHKMIRLVTATLGGEGYLTFMGNEFGHPEWIDFPREGNGWSYHHCRRQWSLAENKDLKFRFLREFEKDMVSLIKKQKVLGAKDTQLMLHNDNKQLFYKKGEGYFAFNFHPTRSYEGMFLPVPEMGQYQVIMSTDDFCYGGQGRIHHQVYNTVQNTDGKIGIQLYLPSRTALVLKKVK